MKRIVSLLLAACLMAAMVPMNVVAATAPSIKEIAVDTVNATGGGTTWTASISTAVASNFSVSILLNGSGFVYYEGEKIEESNGIYIISGVDYNNLSNGKMWFALFDDDGNNATSIVLTIATIAADNDTTIKSFTVSGQYGMTEFNYAAHLITLMVPPSYIGAEQSPKILTTSSKAYYEFVGGGEDKTKAYVGDNTLKVTAESGATRIYTVIVKNLLTETNVLQALSFQKIASGENFSGTIDQKNNLVSVNIENACADRNGKYSIQLFYTIANVSMVEFCKADGETWKDNVYTGSALDLSEYIPLSKYESLDGKEMKLRVTFDKQYYREYTVQFHVTEVAPTVKSIVVAGNEASGLDTVWQGVVRKRQAQDFDVDVTLRDNVGRVLYGDTEIEPDNDQVYSIKGINYSDLSDGKLTFTVASPGKAATKTVTLRIGLFTPSTDNRVSSFLLGGEYGLIMGATTIQVTVPFGFTAGKPVISIPEEAVIEDADFGCEDQNGNVVDGPALTPGADGDDPKYFTVTAESGDQERYAVYVKTNSAISAFSGAGERVPASIDKENRIITARYPYGTVSDETGHWEFTPTFSTGYSGLTVSARKTNGELEALTSGSAIECSDYAALIPGQPIDLARGQEGESIVTEIPLLVSDNAGHQESWILRFDVLDGDPNPQIKSFSVGEYEGKINGKDIELALPDAARTAEGEAKLGVSPNVKVKSVEKETELSGAEDGSGIAALPIDLTKDQQTLEVTAADPGDLPRPATATYTLTISRQDVFNSFSVSGQRKTARIDETEKTITVYLPYGTNTNEYREWKFTPIYESDISGLSIKTTNIITGEEVALPNGGEIDLSIMANLAANSPVDWARDGDQTVQTVVALSVAFPEGAQETWRLYFDVLDGTTDAEISTFSVGKYVAAIEGETIKIALPEKIRKTVTAAKVGVSSGVRVDVTGSDSYGIGASDGTGIHALTLDLSQETQALKVTAADAGDNDTQATKYYVLRIVTLEVKTAEISDMYLVDSEGNEYAATIDQSAGTVTFTLPAEAGAPDGLVGWKLFWEATGTPSDELPISSSILTEEAVAAITKANEETGAFDGETKGPAFTVTYEDSSKSYQIIIEVTPQLVRFDAAGGSVAPSSKSVAVGELYGELPVPTREGYTFIGWYTDEVGGLEITSQSVVNTVSERTLFARWEEIPAAVTPTVKTNSATNVTKTTAVLSGTVEEDGGDSEMTYQIVYWNQNNPSSKYAVALEAVDNHFSVTVVNLVPGAKYCYYAKATNSAGSGTGAVVGFTTEAENEPQSVTVSPSFLSLTVGETYQLVAEVLPAAATDRNVVWSSSEPTIVKVDKNGKVTAKRSGTAVITVTTEANRLTASCTVRVSESAIKGTFDFSEWNMATNTSSYAIDGFDTDTVTRGGNSFIATAYLARWDGAVLEENDPYSAYTGVSRQGYREVAADYHVQDVIWIPSRADTSDNTEIKAAVMKYGAVYETFQVNDRFFDNARKNYYFPESARDATSGHAVAVVGWDDNYPATNFKAKAPGNGAFICKNSWGEDSGDGGYLYISYYDTFFGKGNGGAVFPSIERAKNKTSDSANYNTIYQYDPLGACGSWAFQDTIYMANVFPQAGTALTEDETLKAVSFYTYSKNTLYEVFVVTDYASGSSLNSKGEAVASGVMQEMGYHTVKLDDAVALKAGTRFAVIVKFSAPDGESCVYLEYPEKGYSSKARANSDESYYSKDGTGWRDLTGRFANANFCVKAFTDNGLSLYSARLFSAIDNGARPYESDYVYSADEALKAGIQINPDYIAWEEKKASSLSLMEEGEESAFGEVPAPAEMDGNTVSFVAGVLLPEKYDLRSEGSLTEVRNQGYWGTCWAFASYASLESCLLKKAKSVVTAGWGNMASVGNYLALVGQFGISVDSISFETDTITMALGASQRLSPVISPEYATEDGFVWTSGDESVATVDTNGTVTAHSVGTTVIQIATLDGIISNSCEVTVQASQAVQGVTLERESVIRGIGDTFLVGYTIDPAGAANKTVTWASSDPATVSVNGNGLMTANAIGSAEVTVTTEDGGYSDILTVTVTDGLDHQIMEIVPDLEKDGTALSGVVQAEIANRTGAPVELAVYIALYDDQKQMRGLQERRVSVDVGITDVVLDGLNFPGLGNVDAPLKMKCYIVDLASCVPLAGAVETALS